MECIPEPSLCVLCVCEACVYAVRVSEFAGLAHFSKQRQLCAGVWLCGGLERC